MTNQSVTNHSVTNHSVTNHSVTNHSVTIEDVRGWPALLPAQLADDALGISYATGKRLRLAGQYPLPVLMIGRLNKVRKGDLLELLEPSAAATGPVRLEAVS